MTAFCRYFASTFSGENFKKCLKKLAKSIEKYCKVSTSDVSKRDLLHTGKDDLFKSKIVAKSPLLKSSVLIISVSHCFQTRNCICNFVEQFKVATFVNYNVLSEQVQLHGGEIIFVE